MINKYRIRLKSFIGVIMCICIVLASVLMTFKYVFAAEQNLIGNSSVESAVTKNKPAMWTSQKTGLNHATFSYKGDGHTGSKSLYVNMMYRMSGNASWQHTAVPISGGQEYTYTDYYKSNVITYVDVLYIDRNNVRTVVGLGDVEASATWNQINFKITTPANAVKMIVRHGIAIKGTLQTDDFSLVRNTPAPLPDPIPTPAPEPTPTPVPNPTPTPSIGVNLVANASFEESANTINPDNWVNNSWGNNTATFNYENGGHTGNKSATAKISSYVDGDAKWYATPVTVIPAKKYVYHDYYKSDVNTSVYAAFVDTVGNFKYVKLMDAAPSSNWALYGASFVTPNNAVKATVYHVIESVGSLTIDDVDLREIPSTSSDVIFNGSVEDGGVMPVDWQTAKWGSNTSVFTYVTGDASDGTRSIKVSMSNYVDGDAKWMFAPLSTLTVGKQYRLSASYKGNITPRVVAMYAMQDGTTRYFGLPNPMSVSETVWQKYSDTFMIPEGTKEVSVFMFINANGWVQTDDYKITEHQPVGFNSGLLSMVFDDGHEDNVTTALPLLNNYGFKTTQCYATDFIENQSQTVVDGILTFAASGHEICSHTVTHPFLTSLNSTDLNYELQHSKAYLENITGSTITSFASPYGDYDSNVNTAIAKYYQLHRTVDEGFNSKDNFNPYRLRVQNVLSTTTSSQINSWVKQAQVDKTWLILVYHRVADNPGTYDSYTNVFKENLAIIKQSGIAVKTMRDAIAEISMQL